MEFNNRELLMNRKVGPQNPAAAVSGNKDNGAACVGGALDLMACLGRIGAARIPSLDLATFA